MSMGQLIILIAVMIPIIGIITRHLQQWQKLELQMAVRDVDLRRRFRSFDEVERRVIDIERYVTSPAYGLDRQIRNLTHESAGESP